MLVYAFYNLQIRIYFILFSKDEINGGYVERSEEREGLSLKGEYTYSDGFFQRTGINYHLSNT